MENERKQGKLERETPRRLVNRRAQVKMGGGRGSFAQ